MKNLLRSKLSILLHFMIQNLKTNNLVKESRQNDKYKVKLKLDSIERSKLKDTRQANFFCFKLDESPGCKTFCRREQNF